MNKDLGYQLYSSPDILSEDSEEETATEDNSKNEEDDFCFPQISDLEEEIDELTRENAMLRGKNSKMKTKLKEIKKGIRNLEKSHYPKVPTRRSEIEKADCSVTKRTAPPANLVPPDIKSGNQILLFKPIVLIGNPSSMGAVLNNWEKGDKNV